MDLEVPLTSRDEDVSGVKRAKVRNPKSRDKWSLLWFIPPSVLNDREVSFDGRKGKRHGFDRFNDLCCKTCHRSFHNSEVLSIHRSETHKNTHNAPSYTPNPSTRSRLSSSYSPSTRSSLISGPVRRSSRRSNTKINYCDDGEIEILDGPSDTLYKTQTQARRNESGEIEEVFIDEDDEDSIEELEHETSILITRVTRKKNDDEEILVMKDDDIAEEPDTPILETSSVQLARAEDSIEELENLNTSVLIKSSDDEVLIMEDDHDDDIEIVDVNNKRKKQKSTQISPTNKKSKVTIPVSDLINIDDDEENDAVIEVQSSSGKRMLVRKSVLNKVGLSPPTSRRRPIGVH